MSHSCVTVPMLEVQSQGISRLVLPPKPLGVNSSLPLQLRAASLWSLLPSSCDLSASLWIPYRDTCHWCWGHMSNPGDFTSVPLTSFCLQRPFFQIRSCLQGLGGGFVSPTLVTVACGDPDPHCGVQGAGNFWGGLEAEEINK